MGIDLGTFLAVIGTAFDGNPISSDPGYSIGGPATSENILGGLLQTPLGLSGSHNNYESDTSPTRGDLYVVYVPLRLLRPPLQRSNTSMILILSSGNDYLLQVDRFQEYYDALPEDTVTPTSTSSYPDFQ